MKAFWSLLLLVISTVSVAAQTGNEPKNVTQLYGKKALRIIGNPDSVSAVLLHDRNGRVSERGHPVSLPYEAQRSAARLLSSNAAYGWNVWKPCMPQYGSRLIFHRGTQSVTFDFCFDCVILTVTPAVRSEKSVDFGPSRKRWLQLFKDQFPKDKLLRAIQ